MIWNISWKNVWRSKSRSLIVISAITIGTIAGVFTNGLMNGWVQQRIRAAVYTEMSHIKIRNKNYLKNEEIKYTIPHIDSIINFLTSSPEVKSFTMHENIMCLAQTPWGNTGMFIKGIDIEKEKEVSDLYKYVLPNAGNYLEQDQRYPILISDKTAEQLRLKNFRITNEVIDSLKTLGIENNIIDKLQPIENKLFRTEKSFKKELENLLSKKELSENRGKIVETAKNYNLRKKITLSFVGKEGSSVQFPFRVCGVYKTSNSSFDMMNAFIKHDDLLKMSGLNENEFHEINIILNDPDENLKPFTKKLESEFKGLSIMTWKELAPDAGMMSDFMFLYYFIIMGFIFFALAFGIINTMLMAILERVKELGMLMAVGMSKKRVFRMIMLETIFLTLTGSVIGMVLGWILIQITGKTGLSFTSVAEGFEAIGWAAKVYPTIELNFFFGITVMVIVVGILSSILPAKKALKLNPSEALRVDM